MLRASMRVAVSGSWLVVSCVAACGGPSAPDAALVDARVSVDAAVDGARADAAVSADASMPLDARREDAFMPDAAFDDAALDDAFVPDAWAFDCGSCEERPCQTLRCEGSCEYELARDGTACGDGVCVEGTCEVRRCGDGWRERGDSSAPFEECDDRNLVSGDGCSAACVPELIELDRRELGRAFEIAGTAPALGVDGLGNRVILYVDGSTSVIRRIDRFGAEDRVELGGRAAATTVGLRDGFVVLGGYGPELDFRAYWRVVPVRGAFSTGVGPTAFRTRDTSMNEPSGDFHAFRVGVGTATERVLLTWGVRRTLAEPFYEHRYQEVSMDGVAGAGGVYGARSTRLTRVCARHGSDEWARVTAVSSTGLRFQRFRGTTALDSEEVVLGTGTYDTADCAPTETGYLFGGVSVEGSGLTSTATLHLYAIPASGAVGTPTPVSHPLTNGAQELALTMTTLDASRYLLLRGYVAFDATTMLHEGGAAWGTNIDAFVTRMRRPRTFREGAFVERDGVHHLLFIEEGLGTPPPRLQYTSFASRP